MDKSPNLNLKSLLESSEDQRRLLHVAVVGDLMIDRYIWGDVGRISPEAPVPVVRMNRKTARPGGAANVAMNLTGLGVNAHVFGCVGSDENGKELKRLLAERGVETHGIVETENRPTTLKMRVIGSRQQMLRLDDEVTTDINPQTEKRLIDQFRESLDYLDALILSDYAKGVITARVSEALVYESRSAGCPVIVDPKVEDYEQYRGATIIAPNHHELAKAVKKTDESDALLEAGQQVRRAKDIDHLVVTRGKEGISLVNEDGIAHFPATAREVFDVSGAGDTVVATLAVGHLLGASWDDAIELSNLAAGFVIGKVGTVPIEYEELNRAVQEHGRLNQPNKLYELPRLEHQVENWRIHDEQIVFTNGCFDLLHAGHVTYLGRAAQEGERLIVGLNTDSSVKRLKGDPRPVIPEDQRARVLASLESVDAVVLFDEETPIRLIKALRPDVLVKGQDYEESEVVGADEVKSWGGDVTLVPLVEGLSTSRIVEEIRSGARA